MSERSIIHLCHLSAQLYLPKRPVIGGDAGACAHDSVFDLLRHIRDIDLQGQPNGHGKGQLAGVHGLCWLAFGHRYMHAQLVDALLHHACAIA